MSANAWGQAAAAGGPAGIRRNCDYCVKKKVKCNGETPCHMCRRKNLQCVYSVKKKPGPKSRKRDLVDGEATDVDSEPPSPMDKRSKVAHGKGTRSGGCGRGRRYPDEDDALRHVPPSGAYQDYQDYHGYPVDPSALTPVGARAQPREQPMWGPAGFKRAGPEGYCISPGYYQGHGGPQRPPLQLPPGYPHYGGQGYAHGYSGYGGYGAGPAAAAAMRGPPGHFSQYSLPSPLMDGDRVHMLDFLDQPEAAGGGGGGHADGGDGGHSGHHSGGHCAGGGGHPGWGDFALVASPQPREVPVELEHGNSAGESAGNSACSTDSEESFPPDPLSSSSASSSSAGAAAAVAAGKGRAAVEENGEDAADEDDAGRSGEADEEAAEAREEARNHHKMQPYYKGAGAPLHEAPPPESSQHHAQEWRSSGHQHASHVHRRGLSWGQVPPPLPPFHHGYVGGPTLLSPGTYGPGGGGGAGASGADHDHDQDLVHGMFPTMELNGEDYALQHNFGSDLPALAI